MSNDIVIRDVQGQEAVHTLAQFLNQNLGEIKKLDSDIIQKNSTLQGMSIDLNRIGADIPRGQTQPVPVEPFRPSIDPVPPAPQVPTPQISTQIVDSRVEKHTITVVSPNIQPASTIDSKQLELSFNLKPSDIMDRLIDIQSQNRQILTLLKELIPTPNNTKKKN